jgi:hypothetical protein
LTRPRDRDLNAVAKKSGSEAGPVIDHTFYFFAGHRVEVEPLPDDAADARRMKNGQAFDNPVALWIC